ncbi:hypothetical protein ACA910_004153 [Epithemia clementina (nom. ined.)]
MGNNFIQEDADANHHLSLLDLNDNNNNQDDSKVNLTDLQEENNRLKAQLAAIKTQRKKLQEIKAKANRSEEAVLQRINECRHEQDEAFGDLQSAMANRSYKKRQLINMQRWMSLNDCFYIGTQGPFATINGLRLGAEAVVENFDSMRLLPTTSGGEKSSNSNHRNNAQSLPSQSNQARRSGLGDSSRSGGGGGAGMSDNSASVPVVVSLKVPWSEINSALGQLALLLSIIETTPNCGFRYRHEILCMGSTSKMGIRRNGSSSVAYYNLYSDDSFQFFGRRNFNTALQCLLQCVLDASEQIRDKDPTITLPHPIEKPHAAAAARSSSSGGGELTVGGLSVTYGNDGVEWTRAMKYLLTNVKNLLLFRPLGLWGSATQDHKIGPPTLSSSQSNGS